MYYFPAYISVAQQQKDAKKAINKLRKSGFKPKSVEAFSGRIAKSPWGRKWCDNLETYSDALNRLDRGKRYVRAGCVCHLEARNGEIEALVNGASLYKVLVNIKPLRPELWNELQKVIAKNVGSVVELVQGKVPPEVMAVVSRPGTGLFPEMDEISFSCSCPDYAGMCKHVAATLYAIGRRLDEEPSLLFKLRSVDPCDLARFEVPLADDTHSLGLENLGDIFGIDMDMGEEPERSCAVEDGEGSQPASPMAARMRHSLEETGSAPKAPKKAGRRSHPGQSKKKGASGKNPARGKLVVKMMKKEDLRFDGNNPTGKGVKALRKMVNLSQKNFAKKIGVSVSTIIRWEMCDKLALQPGSLKSLVEFQRKFLLEKYAIY